MLGLLSTHIVRCFEGAFPTDTTDTGFSEPISINPDAKCISCQLKVLDTASALIQATISPLEDVIAGNADWVSWSTGYITGGAIAQDASIGPITAIRLSINVAKAGINAFLAIRTTA